MKSFKSLLFRDGHLSGFTEFILATVLVVFLGGLFEGKEGVRLAIVAMGIIGIILLILPQKRIRNKKSR